MKVVVVDDDVVVHMALAMTWDDVEVIECIRVRGAFSIGLVTQPDCFVIDRRLPDGDGLEVVRRLRQDLRTNQIPIVVLSAGYDPEDEVLVLKSGADAYLAKPFEPGELMRVLRGAMLVPAADRRARRQQSIEQLRAGITPDSLIDLTDAAMAREAAANHRKHFWQRHPHAAVG